MPLHVKRPNITSVILLNGFAKRAMRSTSHDLSSPRHQLLNPTKPYTL